MFERLRNLFRGLASQSVSELERADPQALLANEKENLRVQIAKYNQGLAAHAGRLERLRSQLAQSTAREEPLRNEAAAALRAGNTTAAQEVALKLLHLRDQIAGQQAELAQAEASYQELRDGRDRTVQAAKDKLQRVEAGLADRDRRQAQSEIDQVASGMLAEGDGGVSLEDPNAGINRLEELVEEQRALAEGRLRVARAVAPPAGAAATPASPQDEARRADRALADLAAELGIPLGAPGPAPTASPPEAATPAPAPAEPAPAARKMGPTDPAP